MGHEYGCTDCDFHFFSGFLPEHNCCDAICTHCAQKFEIAPWGPKMPCVGEYGKLFIINNHIAPGYKEDTTQRVTAIFRFSPEGFAWQTDELHCLNCNTKGTIVTEFQSNTPCPRCKTGKVINLSLVANFK